MTEDTQLANAAGVTHLAGATHPPIVHPPQKAFRTFTRSGMDVLVLREPRDRNNRRPDAEEGAYVRIVQSVANRPGIATELLQFFWQRKWWWISPIIVMVLWLVGMAVFAHSPAPPPVDLYNIFSGEIEKCCLLG